jgi:glycosyltransferase involved in cell wall biosynthesis
MTTAAQPTTIAILLCTHNGARFLAEQLESIAAQTHQNWTVWASDDGSTDATAAILSQYRSRWGGEKLRILAGPGKGSSANFLALVCNGEIEADYFSYADQDDIWHPDKLERALAMLAAVSAARPALYLSRSCLIDEAGRELGLSRLFTRPPSFKNALVQNIGGGNTMVFNSAARSVIAAAGLDVEVVVHDWWTYMAVSGCGGEVLSDPAPSLKYRQHGANQIGSNIGLSARLFRAGQLLEGRFRAWMDVNLAALARIETRLTAENAQVLRTFRAARAAPLMGRLIGLARSGITRQSLIDNLGLYLAAALNRI